MFVFRCGEEASGFHGGVGIHGQVRRESAAEIRAFDDVALVAGDVSQLPLKRGDGDFVYRRAELFDGYGVFERELFAQLFILGMTAIPGALLETRNEGG